MAQSRVGGGDNRLNAQIELILNPKYQLQDRDIDLFLDIASEQFQVDIVYPNIIKWAKKKTRLTCNGKIIK